MRVGAVGGVVVVVVHSATGGVADVTPDGASTTSGVVHLFIHTATGGVADIAPAGAQVIGMSIGSGLPRHPPLRSRGGWRGRPRPVGVSRATGRRSAGCAAEAHSGAEPDRSGCSVAGTRQQFIFRNFFLLLPGKGCAFPVVA